MRTLLSVALATSIAGSAAFAGEHDPPLPAGKPAGAKAAQLDVGDTAVIATTAAILVAAIALGATQKSYTSVATATSTSP
jgi:hypothetical protein